MSNRNQARDANDRLIQGEYNAVLPVYGDNDVIVPQFDSRGRQLTSNGSSDAFTDSSQYSFLSTAAVQNAIIKNSAGKIYGMQFFNKSASIAYVRIYNMATLPGTGDAANIIWRGMVPALTTASGFIVPLQTPITGVAGLGMRVTLAVGDTDNTILTANDVMGNITFK